MFHIYKYRQNYLQIWAIKRDNHKIFGSVSTWRKWPFSKTYFCYFLISCPLTFLCQIKTKSLKKTPTLFSSSVPLHTDHMRNGCCTHMVSMGDFQNAALMKPVFGSCQPSDARCLTIVHWLHCSGPLNCFRRSSNDPSKRLVWKGPTEPSWYLLAKLDKITIRTGILIYSFTPCNANFTLICTLEIIGILIQSRKAQTFCSGFFEMLWTNLQIWFSFCMKIQLFFFFYFSRINHVLSCRVTRLSMCAAGKQTLAEPGQCSNC